ncbi:MAG: NADH-quinone oxidoreductase subunit M [Planctomycetota bacterium]|nr:NADH-quinone oxidoreductase subunit M [Planctomycetota bacterium]
MGSVLTVLIFLPLVGVLPIYLWRGDDRKHIGMTALGVSLITAAIGVVVLAGYLGETSSKGHYGGFCLETQVHWVGSPEEASAELGALEISYHIGVDGISVWLVLLTALLSPIVIASSFTAIRERSREYYALMLILQAGMTGAFCALDLLLFYVFFEFTLIPLYLIIGIWGGAERRRAANKFFIYTVAGSVLTFAGILYLGYYGFAHGDTGILTFDLPKLYALVQAGVIPDHVQWWLFLALFAGFAIKVPLFPFHTWLPLAHTEAPTAGSALLAGVLLKLGTYGFLRFSLPLLPSASMALAPFMAVVAIVGIIYAALVAWVQTDVKKLVAYSSVSHLGFCVLGMFSLKIAGVSGAVLYMLNHGLSTAALFLVIGMIYERYHTREMSEIGGLARPMPWMAFFLVFFTLSSIGLPGLNGFWGEFLVLVGTALSGTSYDGLPAGPLGFAYAIPAASGIILGAIYMLWMCRRVLFGPVVEPANTPDQSGGLTRDLTKREIGILVPIALLCVLIGVYPKSIQSSINPTIAANVFHQRTDSFAAAVVQPDMLADAGTGEMHP